MTRQFPSLAAAARRDDATDRELLEAFAQANDQAAFATLVRRHGPMVRRLCRRALGNEADADDAFQATFCVLARKAGTILRGEALASWLHGVAFRAALSAKRRAARRRRHEAQARATPPPNPAWQAAWREVQAVLDEEVRRLPARYRAAFLLCVLENVSGADTARQLGIPEATVRSRLTRARDRLRQRLARRGIDLSAVLAGGAVAAETGAAEISAARAAEVARLAADFTRGTAGSASAEAAQLATHILWGISLRRTQWVVSLLLVLGMMAVGGGLVARQALAPNQSDETATGVQQAVDGPQPSAGGPWGEPPPDGAIARLGTQRFRGVRGCLAYAPGGTWLATTTGDAGQDVTLWDPATGRPLRRFPGQETLSQFSVSPDGTLLAASGGQWCRVLQAATAKERYRFRGAFGLFSGDGRTFITADRSGATLHCHDLATGRPLRELPVGGAVVDLSLARDSRTLAVVTQADPTTVVLFDHGTGALGQTISVGKDGVRWLALSPDGKRLAIADGTRVLLWETATCKQVAAWAQRADSRPVFSADGRYLAWTGFNTEVGMIRLWLVPRDGGKLRQIGTPVNHAESPCFSPDGRALAVVTDAHLVQIRAVSDGSELVPLAAHDSPVTGLVLSADGRTVVSWSRTAVLTWDARSGRLLHRLPGEGQGTEKFLALLPGGRLLTEDRTDDPRNGLFRVRNARTGKEVWRFEGRPDVGEVRVAPGGRFAALSGRGKEWLCVIDLDTGRCRYRLDPQGGAFGLRLSADGDVLVWHRPSDKGPEVHVHRASGEAFVLRGLPAGNQAERWLRDLPYVSPDGRWLLLPDAARVRRWDLTTGREALPLTGAYRTIWYLYWSPDGRLVAAHGRETEPWVIDHQAEQGQRVWDVAAGRRLHQLDQAGSPLARLFSADGRTLFTTDLEGVIHLWEVATGKERARLAGHLPGEIGALALSADGWTLASGGYDSQVLLWDLTGR